MPLGFTRSVARRVMQCDACHALIYPGESYLRVFGSFGTGCWCLNHAEPIMPPSRPSNDN